MVGIGIVIAVILSLLVIGLYFTRQDTHETNIHLAKISKQIEQILEHIKQK